MPCICHVIKYLAITADDEHAEVTFHDSAAKQVFSMRTKQAKPSFFPLTGSLPPALSGIYATMGYSGFEVLRNPGLCGSITLFPGITTANTNLGNPCPLPPRE